MKDWPVFSDQAGSIAQKLRVRDEGPAGPRSELALSFNWITSCLPTIHPVATVNAPPSGRIAFYFEPVKFQVRWVSGSMGFGEIRSFGHPPVRENFARRTSLRDQRRPTNLAYSMEVPMGLRPTKEDEESGRGPRESMICAGSSTGRCSSPCMRASRQKLTKLIGPAGNVQCASIGEGPLGSPCRTTVGGVQHFRNACGHEPGP